MSALLHLPIHASGVAVGTLAQSEPISSCSLGQGWSRYTVFYWGCYGVQKWTWQSVQSWLTISRLGMGYCSLLWLLHRTYVSPILVQPDNVVRPTKRPCKPWKSWLLAHTGILCPRLRRTVHYNTSESSACPTLYLRACDWATPQASVSPYTTSSL